VALLFLQALQCSRYPHQHDTPRPTHLSIHVSTHPRTHAPASQISSTALHSVLPRRTSPHSQHVSSERGRRASPHPLAQFVLGAPDFALVDHCTPQIAPGAHHRSAGSQPATVSARCLSGCHPHYRRRRGADASCSVSTATVCGNIRKSFAASLILLPPWSQRFLIRSASQQLPHLPCSVAALYSL
jgi:hypothetical protein